MTINSCLGMLGMDVNVYHSAAKDPPFKPCQLIGHLAPGPLKRFELLLKPDLRGGDLGSPARAALPLGMGLLARFEPPPHVGEDSGR